MVRLGLMFLFKGSGTVCVCVCGFLGQGFDLRKGTRTLAREASYWTLTTVNLHYYFNLYL